MSDGNPVPGIFDGMAAYPGKRGTIVLIRNHENRRLAPLVHRAELFNGTDVYGWVAESGVPAVASGDVHAAEHLRSWKTLLPCGKDEGEVVAYLRSDRPAYLVPYRPADAVEPAAAA